MAKQTINIGTVAGDGTGDQIRSAFDKTNQNFTELYTDVAALQPLDATLTALAAVAYGAGTQVLTLTAADTFTLQTVGAAAGNILDKASGDSLYKPVTYTMNTQVAATYTLVLGDENKYVILTDATGVALTIPTNASVAFPVGTEIAVQQGGVGAVTIAGDTGVTVNSQLTLVTNGQYAVAKLVKTGADTWVVYGDLVP
jgi:hypothetical protein